MSKERKTILIPHVVTVEEERKLKFQHFLDGYELALKIIDYEKKQSCFKFIKSSTKQN